MQITNLDSDMIFKMATAKRNENSQTKVFDWHKAVRIIKKHNIKNASAGLAEDWDYTGGTILKNGNPIFDGDTYTYLSSVWATPVLLIEGTYDGIECWCWDDQCDWDAKTYWPRTALWLMENE